MHRMRWDDRARTLQCYTYKGDRPDPNRWWGYREPLPGVLAQLSFTFAPDYEAV